MSKENKLTKKELAVIKETSSYFFYLIGLLSLIHNRDYIFLFLKLEKLKDEFNKLNYKHNVFGQIKQLKKELK